MAGEQLSMREAARLLGVSQLRVRELIRKGTLQAEKITENGGERWAIVATSVEGYLERRGPREPSPNGQSSPLGELISGLERQVTLARSLMDEIGKNQKLLQRLLPEREATSSTSTNGDTGRDAPVVASQPPVAKPKPQPRAEEPKPKPAAKIEAPRAPKPKPAPKRPEAGATKAAKPKPAPSAGAKAQPPKSGAAKPKDETAKASAGEGKAPKKTETSLGAALRQAGVTAGKVASKKDAAKGSKRSS